jgi:glycolate oxidase FAD binding subunit
MPAPACSICAWGSRPLANRWRNAVVLACAPELKADLPLWGADPPGLDVMRTIKRQFDPAGLLNPGRFVGGL